MDRAFRTSLLTAIFGILLLVISATPAASSTPAPVVDGNLIRDSRTGEEFIPHGVNWPSFEYACQQGWGYSNLGATSETVEAMLGWKINTVRIPLNQDCWMGEDGLPTTRPSVPVPLTRDGYRQAVEDFVDLLTEAGIVAILDLHWSAPPGYQADGLRPMADSRSDEFWFSVADRFRENRGVIFDLFNEPHSRWDANREKTPPESGMGAWDFRLTWQIWRDGGGLATNHADTQYPFTRPQFNTTGMQMLVSAVRAAGATQPIVLSGLDYANDVSRWNEFAPVDGQLIAGFHNYPGQRCNSRPCWEDEVAELSTRVPVIATEFGQNDCRADFIESFMNWADDFHIGYLAWAWWDLDLPGGAPSCTNYALIDDLDGTPTPVYGEALRDHLTGLPDVLPDVKVLPKRDPGLRILNSSLRKRRLKVGVGIEPAATGPVKLRVRIARSDIRPKKFRALSATLRPVDGRGFLVRKIPGRWLPVQVTVRYPGDQRLLPKKTTRRVKAGLGRKR